MSVDFLAWFRSESCSAVSCRGESQKTFSKKQGKTGFFPSLKLFVNPLVWIQSSGKTFQEYHTVKHKHPTITSTNFLIQSNILPDEKLAEHTAAASGCVYWSTAIQCSRLQLVSWVFNLCLIFACLRSKLSKEIKLEMTGADIPKRIHQPLNLFVSLLFLPEGRW